MGRDARDNRNRRLERLQGKRKNLQTQLESVIGSVNAIRGAIEFCDAEIEEETKKAEPPKK